MKLCFELSISVLQVRIEGKSRDIRVWIEIVSQMVWMKSLSGTSDNRMAFGDLTVFLTSGGLVD